MQFVEAFNSLGYQIENRRQDWSADKPDGVCLTLWSKETDSKLLVSDTRVHADDITIWGHKNGNKKRIQHAKRAVDEFDGWIDVVKIDGEPGIGYGNAAPWIIEERKGHKWRIIYLDEESDHLRIEAHTPS